MIMITLSFPSPFSLPNSSSLIPSFFETATFARFPLCPPGSINVDFLVEAQGSDADSAAALRNSATSLQSELANGSVSMSIGGQSFKAPKQNVTMAIVDVTPAINKTYPFELKVI